MDIKLSSPKRKKIIRTGFLIHDVSRLRHIVFDQQVRPLVDITRPQWWLMIQLARSQDQCLTQVELAGVLDIGKVAMGKMIDRLETKGLVVRVADAEDRRLKRVKLSARGQQRIAEAQDIAVDQNPQIMRGIPAAKQDELEQMLAIIRRNLLALAKSTPE